MVQASEKCFASMIATAAVAIEIDTAHFIELAYTGFYKKLDIALACISVAYLAKPYIFLVLSFLMMKFTQNWNAKWR